MVSRTPSVRRSEQQLLPVVDVLVVRGDLVFLISAKSVSASAVGLKAFGLASLPPKWTKPFFVVSGEIAPTQRALEEACGSAGLGTVDNFIVRSSGVCETMDRRGQLDSAPCSRTMLLSDLARLRASAGQFENHPHTSIVHWVVQERILTQAKGHLSNERRIAEAKRDWMAEVEASDTHTIASHRISLRRWRDDSPLPTESEPLACFYRENYIDSLTQVARWAYQRLIRTHFEWVWDGHNVFIVQADSCGEHADGVQPEKLVIVPKPFIASVLEVFRPAADQDYAKYRKLGNAALYRRLGYDMAPFFVLDDEAQIAAIVDEGRCSEALFRDLRTLATSAMVIRTDGLVIPDGYRQMLPRSEELRSGEVAVEWLTNVFRAKAQQLCSDASVSRSSCGLCLIVHHFVPAASAAWCQARPEQRRVRIESLWGIPEGLYWHAHDVFDVDTNVMDLGDAKNQPINMTIRERLRFKEHFIAPDASGNWIRHRTAAGPDWRRSIKYESWIKEVAWTSRRIANAVGHAVVVMWLIDIPSSVTKHAVVPWYHEEWRPDGSPHRAAPRRKLASSTDFELASSEDWISLQQRVAAGEQIVRVRVQPREPDLVRNSSFAKEIGQFAKDNDLVIELEGGLLSHAYYLLSRTGCKVECADLDGYATDDSELEFNKLVRDRIPDNISARGEAVSLLRLRGEALIAALRRKLVEESLEVLDALASDEIAEELADVREVMLALMSRLNIAEADIEARRKKKAKARGTFDSALMLTRTTLAPSLGFREFLAQDATIGGHHLVTTIDKMAEIPAAFEDIHVDRRIDSGGTMERQFTVDLPAHAAGYHPARVAFSLPTPDGTTHDMNFELLMSRNGSDLRLRVRILNAPVQLELAFSDSPCR